MSDPAVLDHRTGPAMLVRLREAAPLLSMTEKALRHRIDRGQIPVIRIGRSLFIRRPDLLRLTTEGRGLSPTRSR